MLQVFALWVVISSGMLFVSLYQLYVVRRISTGTWPWTVIFFFVAGLASIPRLIVEPKPIFSRSGEEFESVFLLSQFAGIWEQVGFLCTTIPLACMALSLFLGGGNQVLTLTRLTPPRIVWLALVALPVVLAPLTERPLVNERLFILLAAGWGLGNPLSPVIASFSIRLMLIINSAVALLSILAAAADLPGSMSGAMDEDGISRLQGITFHPNYLGHLCAIGIALSLEPAAGGRLLRWCCGVILSLAMVQTYSKTAFIATAIIVLLRLRINMFSMVGIALLGLIGLPFLNVILHAVGTSQAGILSMTGRNVIWQTALSDAGNWWIFGYGTGFLDQEFRASLGLPGYAAQAHNQFIQTFGEGGLVGLSVLISLLAWMWVKCIRQRDMSFRQLGIALLIVFMVTCMTESALRISALDPSFLNFCMMLTIVFQVGDPATPMKSAAISPSARAEIPRPAAIAVP
jgi:hypothetical protein